MEKIVNPFAPYQQNRKSYFVTFSSALPNRKFTLFLRKILN